ncbi:MAG: hypothetical protein RMK29_12895 [Myxococcales bacterium]|nr:hypothetical protein [Myxococcota bacterium]MDW8282602.1 hypothetical protein [Myxococcales bacterium]
MPPSSLRPQDRPATDLHLLRLDRLRSLRPDAAGSWRELLAAPLGPIGCGGAGGLLRAVRQELSSDRSDRISFRLSMAGPSPFLRTAGVTAARPDRVRPLLGAAAHLERLLAWIDVAMAQRQRGCAAPALSTALRAPSRREARRDLLCPRPWVPSWTLTQPLRANKLF